MNKITTTIFFPLIALILSAPLTYIGLKEFIRKTSASVEISIQANRYRIDPMTEKFVLSAIESMNKELPKNTYPNEIEKKWKGLQPYELFTSGGFHTLRVTNLSETKVIRGINLNVKEYGMAIAAIYNSGSSPQIEQFSRILKIPELHSGDTITIHMWTHSYSGEDTADLWSASTDNNELVEIVNGSYKSTYNLISSILIPIIVALSAFALGYLVSRWTEAKKLTS